ncbi:MAG: hypothetical protein AB1650_09740 [Candidatus Omnitrophota bacterium]
MFKYFFPFMVLLIIVPVSAVKAQHDHGTYEAREKPQSGHGMTAMYGGYPASRESSGTSWQPQSAPMEGLEMTIGEWMTMTHGFIYGVYNKQEGDRGDEELHTNSMFMFMAHRPFNEGRIGFRSMFSLDPIKGKDGYPLLLQTGETPDGVSPLVDRQHPHDFVSELALTYSYPVSEKDSWFAYFGLPGEPALGPTPYPHRFPGLFNPEAPLSHHWIDATHITFGVATLGYIRNTVKAEASVFRGREPDEDRWDIEAPKFDSISGRLTYNPTNNWSMQISAGHIDSPEQLEPLTDMNRYTASVTHNKPLDENNWQSTLAWGRNTKFPGKSTDAFLFETAVNIRKAHTFFSRAEQVEKDELFDHDDPLSGTHTVRKATAGYIYDFPAWKNVRWGIGFSVGINFIPDDIESVYGKTPMSYLAFVRMKLE